MAAVLLLTLVAALAVGGYLVRSSEDPISVLPSEVLPSGPPVALVSPSPDTPSTEPSASAAATPSPEPTPRCPSPSGAVEEPTVWAAIDAVAKVVTTPGSFAVATCTTTRIDDRVPRDPTAPLSAHPGGSVEISATPGRRFVGWEGFDASVDQEGANVWPAATLPDQPITFRVPVPGREGLSRVGLELTMSGEDGRAIAHLGVAFLVQVDPLEAPIGLRRAPTDLGCDSIGLEYRTATLRIDVSAAEQVWAEADDGSRLGVLWSESFVGGTASDPVVRDAAGKVVARDGDRIVDPTGTWAGSHGVFVCAGTTDIYVLDYRPG